jgi:beta-carotene 3-hydroxylase
VHHKNQYKQEGECFGMLIVPMKYFKAEAKFKHAKSAR